MNTNRVFIASLIEKSNEHFIVLLDILYIEAAILFAGNLKFFIHQPHKVMVYLIIGILNETFVSQHSTFITFKYLLQ